MTEHVFKNREMGKGMSEFYVMILSMNKTDLFFNLSTGTTGRRSL